MKRSATIAMLVALAVAAAGAQTAAGSAQAPTVSEKRDIAVFALGYYGWNIPLEALGSIDAEIQKVFVDLGRFNIIGVTQRMSSGGLQDFIGAVKKVKSENLTIPEKYQFGEAIFTEAEFNRLLGAFVVAVPVVSSFISEWNYQSGQWTADIKTNVTFIDVSSGGSVLGVAQVATTGRDNGSQLAAVEGAIEAIPVQLQFEIRKITAFQINTRILATSGGEVRIQLGADMGLKKGDEYSVIRATMLQGLRDEREVGLVLIKDVGPQISTGVVLYGGAEITADAQLREVPRLGVDVEPFFSYLSGPVHVMPGMRFVPSRGFYGFRPYATVEIPIGVQTNIYGIAVLPVNVVVGGQYDLHLGRLTFSPCAGVGLSYIYGVEGLTSSNSSSNYLSHLGVQALFQISWLNSRDMRIYIEGGGEYWASISSFFDPYYGLSAGVGLAWKL
jgi:hypothetical protein